ncbi:MAG: hypothetical protein OHK003_08220 [Anaerolineales bacterium]
MKKVIFSPLILLLLAACGASAPPAYPLPSPAAPQVLNPVVDIATPVCINPAPAQADIDRALSFPGAVFDTDDWERTYTVSTDKVIVSWYNDTIPSIVNLEALIFPCQYEEVDLDLFFSADSWSIIFGNYQSYQYLGGCRNDSGLRLYHLNAVDQDIQYQVRYWVVNDTPTRVITFMLVLPTNADAQMDEFAYSLFPMLTTCP